MRNFKKKSLRFIRIYKLVVARTRKSTQFRAKEWMFPRVGCIMISNTLTMSKYLHYSSVNT